MPKLQKYETLDPKSDVVFKAIFSQENELAQTDISAKKVRLDLHCILDDKSHVIVEMQSRPTADDIIEKSPKTK